MKGTPKNEKDHRKFLPPTESYSSSPSREVIGGLRYQLGCPGKLFIPPATREELNINRHRFYVPLGP